MIKKIILILTLFIIMFSTTACEKTEKSMILFNSDPITVETAMNASHVFESGQRIYYLFFTPKELTTKFIRVQVFKRSDVVDRGGYSIVWTCDYRLMKQNMYYYYNHFTIYEKGRYVMQVFSIDNLAKPIAYNEFVIK